MPRVGPAHPARPRALGLRETAAPEGDSGLRRSLWGPCRRRGRLGPGARPGTPGVPPRTAAAREPRSRRTPEGAARGQVGPLGAAGPQRGAEDGGAAGPGTAARGRGAARSAGPARLERRPSPRGASSPLAAPRPAPAPPRAAAVPRVALPRDGPRASALPHGARGGAAAAALGGRAATGAAAAAAARRVRGRLGPSGRRQHVGYQGKSCRPGPAHEQTR